MKEWFAKNWFGVAFTLFGLGVVVMGWLIYVGKREEDINKKIEHEIKMREISASIIVPPDTTVIRLQREIDSLQRLRENAKLDATQVGRIISMPTDSLLRDITKWNDEQYGKAQ